jgi:hypothetical protein
MDKQEFKKWLDGSQLVNSLYLAKLFHDACEKASKKVGWKTQEDCQVKFHELPEANKKAMVLTCEEIMKHFYVVRKYE